MTMNTFGGLDTGIKDKPPLFAFPIYHFPWIVYCRLKGSAGACSKQIGYGFRSLLACQSGHLDLTAKVLLF